jgi:hypothetical protein
MVFRSGDVPSVGGTYVPPKSIIASRGKHSKLSSECGFNNSMSAVLTPHQPTMWEEFGWLEPAVIITLVWQKDTTHTCSVGCIRYLRDWSLNGKGNPLYFSQIQAGIGTPNASPYPPELNGSRGADCWHRRSSWCWQLQRKEGEQLCD